MRTKSLTLDVNRQQPHLMPKNMNVEGGKFDLPNDLPFLQEKAFVAADGNDTSESKPIAFVDSSVSNPGSTPRDTLDCTGTCCP